MDKRFIVSRGGREFVLFAGLLDIAHSAGLKLVTTELLQIPNESNGNVAVAKARVEVEKGVFEAHGDASAENTAPMVRTALIRMAETRAVARALRFATNIGATSLEELGDDDAPTAEPTPRPPQAAPRPPSTWQARAPAR